MPSKKQTTPKSSTQPINVTRDVAKGTAIRYLKNPQTITKEIRTVVPRTVLVDKGALGVWAYNIGYQSDHESMASLLANPGVAESAAKFFMMPGIAYKILSALFPSKDQRFRASNILMNHYTIASAIRRIVPADMSMLTTEGVTSVVAAVLVDVFTQFKVVMPSTPEVFIAPRDRLFPNRDVLIHAVRTSAITDILANADVDLKIKDRKGFYSVAAVAANLEPLLQNIGRALLEIPRLERYVTDSLQIVRAYAAHDTQYVNYPAELQSNADMLEMMENFTILQAALETEPMAVVTPVHKLEYALHYTNLALKTSKRFETRPVELCGTLFDHIHVTDREGLRRGVFVFGNVEGEARSQVTHFMAQEQRGGTYSQAPLTDAEDVLNAITGGFFNDVSPARACSSCATLLDSVAEKIETPVLATSMISELSLSHYAACLADAIQVGVGEDNRLNVQYTLTVDSVQVPASVLHYGRLVATTDPGFVALMAEPVPSNTKIPTHVQTIPDDCRRMFLGMDPAAIAKPLTQTVEMELVYGQNKYKVATTLGKLINISFTDDVFVTIPQVNRSIVAETISLFRDVINVVELCHVSASEKDPGIPDDFDLSLFKNQAALTLAGMFLPTFTSLSAEALSRSIHNLVLQTEASKEQRDKLRTRMQHRQSRMEAQIWASLLVLNKAAWLPYADIQWILDLFKETRIYPTLASSFK